MFFDRIENAFKPRPRDDSFKLHHADSFIDFVMPYGWSENASTHFINDCFYDGDLPERLTPIPEEGIPSWLWRHIAEPLRHPTHNRTLRSENDIRLVLHRVIGAITYEGYKQSLFADEASAINFYQGLTYLVLIQAITFDKDTWKNMGLDWAYGIQKQSPPPLPHIHSLFPKGEQSFFGLQHVLEKTQHEAMMAGTTQTVLFDAKHQECLTFINFRLSFEADQVARTMGRKVLNYHTLHIMNACDRSHRQGFNPLYNRELDRAIDNARQDGISEGAIAAALMRAQQGHETSPLALKASKQAEVVDHFMLKPILMMGHSVMEAIITGHGIEQYNTQHEPTARLSASQFFDHLAEAISNSASPKLLFSDTVDAFAALPQELYPFGCDSSGASIFVNDTDLKIGYLNIPSLQSATELKYAVRFLTAALELIDAANPLKHKTQKPPAIAIRPLGYASFALKNALPYENVQSLSLYADLTALITAIAFETSLDIAAKTKQPSDLMRLHKTRLTNMLRYQYHALIGQNASFRDWTMRPFSPKSLRAPLSQYHGEAVASFEKILNRLKTEAPAHFYVTDLLSDYHHEQNYLDCKTAGLSPLNNLFSFDSLPTAQDQQTPMRYGKQIDLNAVEALRKLGYTAHEIDDITAYVTGHRTLFDAPYINHQTLKAKGFSEAMLSAVEKALQDSLHIRYAFNRWVIGEEMMALLPINHLSPHSPSFDLLTALGFHEDEIDAANLYAKGAMTLEGAPHLKPDHYLIFDCLEKAGDATRDIMPLSILKAHAAVTPFLSGAAQHTLILKPYTSDDDIKDLILKAWEMGLKTLSLYRAGSSYLHPVALMSESSAFISNKKEDNAPAVTAQNAEQKQLFNL